MTPIVHPITKSDEKRLSKPPPPGPDYDRLAWAMVHDGEEELQPLPESLDITEGEIFKAHWQGALLALLFVTPILIGIFVILESL